MLKTIALTVTSFQQHARILVVDGYAGAVVVDPGGEADRIASVLEERDLALEAVWLTHSHLDHCGGVAALIGSSPVPLYGHRVEKEFRSNLQQIAAMYGVVDEGLKDCPEPSNYLSGGERVEFAGYSFEVLFTPGHAPGHLCFYCERANLLLAGDSLFAGSIGRTDLPGGNHQQLLDSIRTQLLVLPDDTRVLPGHGPDTTVGMERLSNPFLLAEESR